MEHSCCLRYSPGPTTSPSGDPLLCPSHVDGFQRPQSAVVDFLAWREALNCLPTNESQISPHLESGCNELDEMVAHSAS